MKKNELVKQKTKAGMILAIIFLSGYLNIEDVISLMLHDMSLAFPQVSVFEIQKIPANMYLIEAVVSLSVGWMASKLSKRKMIILFQSGSVAGALIGYFLGNSFAMIYFSLFVLSLSCAVMSTIARSVVVETFSIEEVPGMISLSQICNTLGTTLLQILGGYLISRSWRMGYLAFLAGLLSLFSALFFLPEGPLEKRETDTVTGGKPKIWTKYLIHDVVFTLLFLCINSTYSTNVSFLVAERDFGDALAAGLLSSVKTGATFLAAVMLTVTLKTAKKYVIIFSAVLMLTGYMLVAAGNQVWIVVAGAALAGFGMGTFTPSIFMHLAKHVTQSTNAASHAMIAAAGTLGNYLYPYCVTLPAMFITDDCRSRFAVAMIWLAVVIVAEFVFQKNEKEY